MKQKPAAVSEVQPIAAASARLRAAAVAWGFTEGSEEEEFLSAMIAWGIALEEKLDGFKTLPFQQIRSDVRRGAAQGWDDAAKAYRQAQTWRTAAAVVLVAVSMLICGGLVVYPFAYDMGASTIAITADETAHVFKEGGSGADWLGNILKNNDVAKLAQSCRDHPYDNGQACQVSMWTGQRKAP